MPVLEITTKIGCINNCDYCPQERLMAAYSKRDDHTYMMTFALFQHCLEKIPPSVDIHFSGMCEPWLNPDCTKMLLYAHRRGHKIAVYTTLVGMQTIDIQLIEKIPFKAFVVHLPSGGGHEQIKVTGAFKDALRALIHNRFLTPAYVVEGESLHPAIATLSITDKLIDYFTPSTRAGNVKIQPYSQFNYIPGVIGCKRNLSHNILLPNGEVVLCCMDYSLRHVIGNLYHSDYAALFSGEEFARVSRGLRDESIDILCRYCDTFAYAQPKGGLVTKLHGLIKAIASRDS